MRPELRRRLTGRCQSPLWDDECFAEDFFRNFGICKLHVLPLGLFKRVAGMLFLLMPERNDFATRTSLATLPSPSIIMSRSDDDCACRGTWQA